MLDFDTITAPDYLDAQDAADAIGVPLKALAPLDDSEHAQRREQLRGLLMRNRWDQ